MEQITIQGVALQEGKRQDGSSWVRYTVTDQQDRKLSTFDEAFGERAKPGAVVRVNIEERELGPGRDGSPRKVKNITSFEFVENGHVDTPAPAYTHQRPDGAPDWDKVALGKSRCLLWGEFFDSQLAAMLYHDAQKVEGRDPISHVLIQGQRLIVHAERDIFERPAGDDGLPI